jgi:hypothetical protein
VVPALSQTHLVHTFPAYFPKIHSNIISSWLGLPRGLFLSVFPNKVLHVFLISPMRATCPAPSGTLWFDHPNNICWAIQVTKLSSSLCSHLQPPASSSLCLAQFESQHWFGFGRPGAITVDVCNGYVHLLISRNLIGLAGRFEQYCIYGYMKRLQNVSRVVWIWGQTLATTLFKT